MHALSLRQPQILYLARQAGLMGVSAIDDDGALPACDIREVCAAQTIMDNTREVILVADASRFSRSAPVRIGHISQVTTFVTDRPPPAPITDICRQNGVTLETVETEMNEARPRHDL